MTDTNTLAPSDVEILDAAEDFRSQYTHGGTTFDEFDEIGFARAVLAKWGTPAPASEPVAGAGVPEPAAYIEHHKGGDNLCWERCGKWTALYTAAQVQAMLAVVPRNATLYDPADVAFSARLEGKP